MNTKNRKSRDIGFYVLIFVILIAVIFILFSSKSSDKMTYSEIRDLFRDEQVTSFVIEDRVLTMNLKE